MFTYEDGQFDGLLTNRPTYVAHAYGAGGYGAGGPLETYDFMKPYLTLLLNFIGLISITSFTVEATAADEACVEAAMSGAMAIIADHLES